MHTAIAEVVSARKGGHSGTPDLRTVVQEICWHQCVAPTCQLWGLPYPGGSSWDLTCTEVLEGFSPQDKQQGRRKCFIPSPRQQGAWMRQMSSFGSSVASGRGKHDRNHNSCKGTRGPTLPAQAGSGISTR